MKTQSPDTSVKAERVLVELIRHAPISKRFKLVQSMTQGTILANIHAWKENHPEASEQEAGIHFVSMTYGSQLAQQAQADLEACETWHLQPGNLLTIISDLAKTFDAFNIPWYLGGSIASSIYGMQQLAQDIDLIVDLSTQHIPLFIPSLKQHYIFDERAIQKAKDKKTSFSILHRNSFTKVDIILGDTCMFSSSRKPGIDRQTLDEQYPDIPVASPYEMILFKLYRYYQDKVSCQDGMINDAEWNDIMGMLKVQAPFLDFSLLDQWIEHLGIRDTWKLVLIDTGLKEA
ncbi:hypothetical protein KDA_30110 [Dictyobacter alpinus]|uniref:Nucleotidyltransferase n=1 Tax=Dictyobacter alpinus TaxID=2014873 RepID=A0A402B881_9CHLR|nr:hypothetical protein [Dictyobacter alpinus]GCE27527.1 hypothetical protein KDA_30110 [Dictyobacter alpinus]